jgi:uncharacterized membrane protein YsdA (DUF1294 family)
MELGFYVFLCLFIVLAIYAVVSTSVYLFFGLDLKEAIKQTLNELKFWEND